MPGFVKTPKDEARWAKAKEAAGKQTDKDSESYWKLSNYIYHKMGKTEEDAKIADIYKFEIVRSFEHVDKLSIENLRSFLMKSDDAQQSLISKEVNTMSTEKKYTAREAGLAVLKKAEEMLKAHALNKSEQIPHKASEEKNATPPDGVQASTAPEDNDKQQVAESGARDWSLKPGVGGTIKLAKFIGHMHAKRKGSGTPPATPGV